MYHLKQTSSTESKLTAQVTILSHQNITKRTYISIINKDIKAIFHVRKSLSYYNDEPWVTNEESNFDVTMGSYDGAEVCELFGMFMLSLLSIHINKNHIGLYRDDGLSRTLAVQKPKTQETSSKNYLKKKIQTLLFNVT